MKNRDEETMLSNYIALLTNHAQGLLDEFMQHTFEPKLQKAITDDNTLLVQEMLMEASILEYEQSKFIVAFFDKKRLAMQQVLNLDFRTTTNPYIIHSLLRSGYPVHLMLKQLCGNVRATNILLKMLPGISREAADELESRLGSEYMCDIGARDAVSYDTTTTPIIYQGVTYDFANMVKQYALRTNNNQPLQLGYSIGKEVKFEEVYLDFKILETLKGKAVEFKINIFKPVPQSTYEVWLAYKNSYWQDYKAMSDLGNKSDYWIMLITLALIFGAMLPQFNSKYEIISPRFTFMFHGEFFATYEYVMARKQLLSYSGFFCGVLNFARLAMGYYFFQPMFNHVYEYGKGRGWPLLYGLIMVTFYTQMLGMFDTAYTNFMSPRLNFVANFSDIKRELTFDYEKAKADIPQAIAKRFAGEFTESHKPASLMFWRQIFETNATKVANQEPEQSTSACSPDFRC